MWYYCTSQRCVEVSLNNEKDLCLKNSSHAYCTDTKLLCNSIQYLEPIFQWGQFSPSGEWTAVKWVPEVWEVTTGFILEEMKVWLSLWCIDVEVYCFLKLLLESTGCGEWFLHSYLYVQGLTEKNTVQNKGPGQIKTKFVLRLCLPGCSTCNSKQRAIWADLFFVSI